MPLLSCATTRRQLKEVNCTKFSRVYSKTSGLVIGTFSQIKRFFDIKFIQCHQGWVRDVQELQVLDCALEAVRTRIDVNKVRLKNCTMELLFVGA